MKNRSVGYIVVGIAILIGFIIFSFNTAMVDIVSTSCTHGTECTMWKTIEFQTNMSIAIMAILIMTGLYLIFFGKEEKIVTRIKKINQQIEPKKITKDNYKKIISGLNKEEKQIFELVIESQGSIAQSELVEKTGLSKVKTTRILDKLQGKNLIERKRRGMSNIIVLKH
ncbi:hypothetical protein CL614_04975 [archaeon]|nr:hypothetical protein [archaeon]|tara:strand:+ start:2473 stop:2979 length:507 start_codon:yes stop_codon:yes gene_type:complete